MNPTLHTRTWYTEPLTLNQTITFVYMRSFRSSYAKVPLPYKNKRISTQMHLRSIYVRINSDLILQHANNHMLIKSVEQCVAPRYSQNLHLRFAQLTKFLLVGCASSALLGTCFGSRLLHVPCLCTMPLATR